jgi:hypothetical protein
MHVLKVNDGSPQLQKMEKGNKLHFNFLFSLIVFFNLKLNAIMSSCGTNLFISNMLANRTDVRFPKHPTKPNYLTHLFATMIFQPIKFGDSNFSLRSIVEQTFH